MFGAAYEITDDVDSVLFKAAPIAGNTFVALVTDVGSLLGHSAVAQGSTTDRFETH